MKNILFRSALALCLSLGLLLPAHAFVSPTTESVQQQSLPPEARATITLIRQNGPFPYRRDGVEFQNRERRLPSQARGYYHEYTVPTPGARDRGARRIITGKPDEFYYTPDHYRSFRKVQP